MMGTLGSWMQSAGARATPEAGLTFKNPKFQAVFERISARSGVGAKPQLDQGPPGAGVYGGGAPSPGIGSQVSPMARAQGGVPGGMGPQVRQMAPGRQALGSVMGARGQGTPMVRLADDDGQEMDVPAAIAETLIARGARRVG